jgi:hypothetical protein
MPKYLFVSTRTTEFEDYIEAETQSEAIKIYDELIADDLTVVSQHFDYRLMGFEIEVA